METKLQRLERAIQYLKGKGIVRRQKDVAAAIIEHYRGTRLLLSWAERCADDRTFAAKTNKALGEIHTGLTTYWARHSWATIAASLDISEDTIALALGHASAHATTSIYIERSLRKVDEANRRVLDAVK